jgi:hypothetical protein
MSNVRNWYIYIVSAISLQAVTWSTIDLLRNLIVYGADPLAVALQLAVIIIGLPVFLVHWLWAQRLAGRNVDERGGILYHLYLYGVMAAFLGSIIPNTFDLIRILLGGSQVYTYTRVLPIGDRVLIHLIAMIVLAALWFYHQRVLQEDTKVVPESGSATTVRRLYVLGFSAAGLTMTTHAVIQVIRWVMLAIGREAVRAGWLDNRLSSEIARLLVGLAIWVLFWLWAQRLFQSPSEEEHASTLRKVYLYGVVFFAAIDAITQTTGILASLIRRLLGVTSTSGDSISQPLPIIITMGILWAYHAYLLQRDAQKTVETGRQAGVRRLYYYLIAGIGLAALLVGLGGEISVLLRALGRSFGAGLKGEFSWFTAAIIAGLPVWIIPWRKVQSTALSADPTHADARRSLVRKIYLYFFLFVAMMTLLSSAVFILYRILRLLLGGNVLTLTDLGQAIAYSLIATGVLLYHGYTLRGDTKRARGELAALLAARQVVLLGLGESPFGKAVAAEIKKEIPEVSLEAISLAAPTTETEAGEADHEATLTRLADADLIVGPWMIAVAGGVAGAVDPAIARAVIASPARKLLIPMPAEGWDWAGVERWNAEAFTRQSARAVKQIVTGELVKLQRPLGAGAIIGIVFGLLILLSLLSVPLIYLFSY